jgi:hypothetical protein
VSPRPSLRERLGGLALRGGGRLLGRHPVVLEYPPPIIDRARWGWGSAPNQALHELISGQRDCYRKALGEIERHAGELGQIEQLWDQTWFTGLDAAALYSLIRARGPARYHEIGSGYSTLFAARAVRDGGLSTHILSVDPQPRVNVQEACEEVLRAPLQRADLNRVGALRAGDVLLLDSSHYVLQGSDVVAFFLEVLPSLPSGVLVGVHDVFLPDDYPWWLSRWYSEQYLLAAWMLGGRDRVKLALPCHFCATDLTLRRELDALWSRTGLPGLAYGSTLWLET